MLKSELKRQGKIRRDMILRLRVEQGYSRRAVAKLLELSLTRINALEVKAIRELGYDCLPDEAIQDLRRKLANREEE